MSFLHEYRTIRLVSYSLAALSLLLASALLLTGAHPATAAGAPVTTGFPRLAIWWPNNDTQSVASRAKTDYIVLQSEDAHHIAELRAANPAIEVLGSTNARELNYRLSNYNDPFNVELRSASTDWILTQVGSRLTSAVTNAQTTIPVADVTKFRSGEMALVDRELVYIDSVGTSTLTVRRGPVNPASSHASGARIASVVSMWPQSITMDLTTNCAKADVGYGPETWAQWNTRRGRGELNSASWDGLMIDCLEANPSFFVTGGRNRSIDPNRSNVAVTDAYAAFNAAWHTGADAYGDALKSAAGSSMVIGNGNMRNFTLNGNIFEGYPYSSLSLTNWRLIFAGPYDYPRASYPEWIAGGADANLTMIQTYGAQTDYQAMRYGLCSALLSDGFYSYALSSSGHARNGIWWYDEYDNAGVGRGYLGQPKGASYAVGGAYRRDYTGGTAIVNPSSSPVTVQLGATYRKIKGTQAPAVNDGSTVTAVTVPPKDGIVLLATGTTSASTRYEQTDPRIKYTGPWTTYSNPALSSGSYQWMNSTGSAVDVKFSGTAISWITVKYKTYGKARVYLDGVLADTVDLYNPTLAWQQTVFSRSGLSAGDHILRIEWTGERNASSTNTYIGVDAFDITGTLLDAGATVDATAPSAAITSPVSGATVSGSVAVAASAADNVGVTRVEFRVDGTLLGSDTTAPYAATWNASAAAPGAHTITATAYDAAGNSKTASIGVSIASGATPGMTRYEQTDPRLAFSGTWSVWNGWLLSGGSYHTADSAGDALDVKFNGTAISWVTATYSGHGKARVYLDGVLADTVDLYSPTVLWQQTVFSRSGLPARDHTLRIEWTAERNEASSGNYVGVDALDIAGTLLDANQIGDLIDPSVSITSPASGATVSGSVAVAASAADNVGVTRVEFRVDGTLLGSDTTAPYAATWNASAAAPGAHTITATAYDAAGNSKSASVSVNVAGSTTPVSTRYEQMDPRIKYTGPWTTYANPALSSGSYQWMNSTGSAVDVKFSGTAISWITVKYRTYGKARVYLDGTLAGTVDLYNPTLAWQQTVFSRSGLSAGDHTLRIEWTGERNASSTYTYVGVDAFDITGTLLDATTP